MLFDPSGWKEITGSIECRDKRVSFPLTPQFIECVIINGGLLGPHRSLIWGGLLDRENLMLSSRNEKNIDHFLVNVRKKQERRS